MKTMIAILMALLISMSSFAASKQKYVIATVKGMVCGFCAQGITKKFQTLSSVEKVEVSLEKKLVTLSLRDGKDLTDQEIEKILKDAGYNIDKIERN